MNRQSAIAAVAGLLVGFVAGYFAHGAATPAGLASTAGEGADAELSTGEGGSPTSDGGTTLDGAPAGSGDDSDGTTETSDTPSGEGTVAVVGGGDAAGAAGASSDGSGGEGGSADAPPPPADGGVPARLDAQSIRDVVGEHRDQLGFCFAWQLHQHPELAGRIVMEFEIGQDGHVARASVADDTLQDETVARCFTSVTRRMEFPAPEGGDTVTVRYPFQLSASEDDAE